MRLNCIRFTFLFSHVCFQTKLFPCISQQEVGLDPFYIFIFACLLSNQVVSPVYHNRNCIHFTFLFSHVCFQTKLFPLYITTGGWTVSIYIFIFTCLLSNQVVSPVYHNRRLDCIHFTFLFFCIGAFKPSCLPCISPFCKSLSCMERFIADQS